MGYVAAVKFCDLQDGKRRYMAGEKYPRPGLTVTDERLAELAGSDNRAGYPLIKKDGVEEAPEKPATEKPKRAPRKRVKGDA